MKNELLDLNFMGGSVCAKLNLAVALEKERRHAEADYVLNELRMSREGDRNRTATALSVLFTLSREGVGAASRIVFKLFESWLTEPLVFQELIRALSEIQCAELVYEALTNLYADNRLSGMIKEKALLFLIPHALEKKADHEKTREYCRELEKISSGAVQSKYFICSLLASGECEEAEHLMSEWLHVTSKENAEYVADFIQKSVIRQHLPDSLNRIRDELTKKVSY